MAALDEGGDREQLGGGHNALAAAPVDPELEHPANSPPGPIGDHPWKTPFQLGGNPQ